MQLTIIVSGHVKTWDKNEDQMQEIRLAQTFPKRTLD